MPLTFEVKAWSNVGPAVEVPVPEIEIVCGLPDALSVNTIDAVRVPMAVGLNAIVKMQLAPAASAP